MSISKNNKLKNTMCFIDCDGTLVDSLKHYNDVIDRLFKGKIARENYIQYYKDFGDKYEIIPGSPWKNILVKLVDYHARKHLIVDNNDNVVDIGWYDAILKIIFGATYIMNIRHGIDNIISNGVALYSTPTELIVLVQGSGVDLNDGNGINANMDASLVFMNGYPDAPSVTGKMMIHDVVDKLVEEFNDMSVRMFSSMDYDELAIDPVIRFCRKYKERGGYLAIHSGSNFEIVEAMLKACGVRDLFDDIVCSDMLSSDPENLGPWGYKDVLIDRLFLDSMGKDIWSRKAFVIGDTKGDGFGALDHSLPFFLVWRGYPKDPMKLRGDNGETMVPDAWIDFTDSALSSMTDDMADSIADEIIDFASRVQND